jgi:putative ABC transport system substrate-binding protein
MYQSREDVEAGGLMSELFRRNAWYVHRILQGAKPAELPIEQPTRFELTINLKTAKALGLTVPPALLRRADEVMAAELPSRGRSRRTLNPQGYR